MTASDAGGPTLNAGSALVHALRMNEEGCVEYPVAGIGSKLLPLKRYLVFEPGWYAAGHVVVGNQEIEY